MPLTNDLIYSFKVSARNNVGSGALSEPISIRAARVADKPTDLSNVASITTAYRVGLDWSEGIYNGGSAVLDYRVSYKQLSADAFTIYESGILTTDSIVYGLEPGITYVFRVEARNLVGYSETSDTVTVLAA